MVTVQHLVKKHGNLAAVNDVSFSIHEGEIFGIIGPNGAGKTTTVERVSGLRAPDSTRAFALLLDRVDVRLRPSNPEAELLLLRHELRVLRGQIKRTQLTPADRMIVAAFHRLASRPGLGGLVKPETKRRRPRRTG